MSHIGRPSAAPLAAAEVTAVPRSARGKKRGFCRLRVGLAVLVAAVSFAATAAAVPKADPWPVVTSSVKKDPRLEARITELLRKMTLEQKVGQMLQADIRSVTPEDVRTYRLGSI